VRIVVSEQQPTVKKDRAGSSVTAKSIAVCFRLPLAIANHDASRHARRTIKKPGARPGFSTLRRVAGMP